MTEVKHDNQQELDPLAAELLDGLSLVVDVKHLNASNIFDALVKGMQIVAKIDTKTDAQKKIILLDCFNYMILQSSLDQTAKEDLIWIVDKMGPTMIEGVLLVAQKGIKVFKNSSCSCFPC